MKTDSTLGTFHFGEYIVGQLQDGKWYVRPIHWAGIWERQRLSNGCNTLFESDLREQAILYAQGCNDCDIMMSHMDRIASPQQLQYRQGFLYALLYHLGQSQFDPRFDVFEHRYIEAIKQLMYEAKGEPKPWQIPEDKEQD